MKAGPPEGEPVPLFDPSAQHAEIREALTGEFERTLAAGVFVLGNQLAAFEAEFSAYCGTGHCVGVASGTDAIRLALAALGVGPGSEVVTVAHTFVATVEAIAANGARPVLVDVDPTTRCMDPGALRAAIGPATAAVVPVHLYGRPAPMGEIGAVCEAAGVPIVEDAAQAHGAVLDGRRAGAWGVAGAFSFYPSKNLGAIGDGGAVVCHDPDLAAAIRSLRHHGCAPEDPNRHLLAGTSSRLDELQAAVLRHKLGRLEVWNEERRRLADRYRERLSVLPLTLPAPDPPGGRQVFHLFVVELDERDRVLAELRRVGIQAAVHYPTPVHLQPAWEALGYREGDLPVTERLARRALSLPLYPGMRDDQIDWVVQALERSLAGG